MSRPTGASMPGDERLARAWRETSREEPAPALDDAIRAAARKAVGAGPRSTPGAPFGGRWRVPLSVAAVLVVSATITLLVAQREEQELSALRDQAAPMAGTPEPPASAPEAASPDFGATEAQPHAAASAASPPTSSDSFVASPPQAPASSKERTLARQTREESDLKGVPAGATGADREPAPRRVATEAESPREGFAEAPAPGDDTSATALRSRAQGVAAAPAPPPAEPSAADTKAQVQRAPATEEPTEGALAKRKAEAAAEMKQDAPEHRQRAAPAARAEKSAVPQPGSNATVGPRDTLACRLDEQTERLEPKVWLDRILDLRRSGKLEEAEKSLKAFRARYPDYPLPDELKPPRRQPE